MAKAKKRQHNSERSGDVHMRVKPARLERWYLAVDTANMGTLTAWLTKLAEDECDRLGIPRAQP